ncbi:MAG TPA: hypothetical protein VKP67_01410 [Xanthobacteraceae bacterium]|nr:hypothetical protein [Xanthobacteraceae bacterium]
MPSLKGAEVEAEGAVRAAAPPVEARVPAVQVAQAPAAGWRAGEPPVAERVPVRQVRREALPGAAVEPARRPRPEVQLGEAAPGRGDGGCDETGTNAIAAARLDHFIRVP